MIIRFILNKYPACSIILNSNMNVKLKVRLATCLDPNVIFKDLSMGLFSLNIFIVHQVVT